MTAVRGPPFAGADQPARRSLEIAAVDLPCGAVPVSNEDLAASPFHTLTVFRVSGRGPGPAVLLVPPLSGHMPILLRDTVLGLLQFRDVALLDWVNVRHVPGRLGSFGFDDNIIAIEQAVRQLGPDVSVLALCQAGVPALAATARLAAAAPAAAPAALALMAAPVDPLANPTELVRFARRIPLSWYRTVPLAPVAPGYAGSGRTVYPARAQLLALRRFLGRQVARNGELARKMAQDDGADPARFPFRDLYTAVMDIDARHYVENIATIFHTRALPAGRLSCAGETVVPSEIRRTRLMTIEGESDPIAAPGQTAAAHDLCTGLSEAQRTSLVVPACGHFSLFHGDTWRARVLPALCRHIEGGS
jgi:poly(3-hydroxybutyrate) depolymerase